MRYLALSLAMALGLIGAPRAIAHSTKIYYQETSAITVAAEYSANAPIAAGEVLVYAPNQPDQPWLKGQTNSAGEFTFAPDRTIEGNWKVVIYSQGHGGEIQIPVAAATPAHTPVETLPTTNPKDGAMAVTANQTPDNTSLGNAPASISTNNPPNYSLSQRLLMVGSIVWGLTGTAMFFHKQESPNS
jgi:nickel transport protein